MYSSSRFQRDSAFSPFHAPDSRDFAKLNSPFLNPNLIFEIRFYQLQSDPHIEKIIKYRFPFRQMLGAQRNKQSLRDTFYAIITRRACFLLSFGVPALWNACPMKYNAYFIWAKPIPLGSTKNNKINNLWVLCDSNERSEWAVSS